MSLFDKLSLDSVQPGYKEEIAAKQDAKRQAALVAAKRTAEGLAAVALPNGVVPVESSQVVHQITRENPVVKVEQTPPEAPAQ